MLRHSPGFAAVVILTMALSIGATTTLFSVVYGVLMRPLPWPDPDRSSGCRKLAVVACRAFHGRCRTERTSPGATLQRPSKSSADGSEAA
jgi:hypothetical protein